MNWLQAAKIVRCPIDGCHTTSRITPKSLSVGVVTWPTPYCAKHPYQEMETVERVGTWNDEQAGGTE